MRLTSLLLGAAGASFAALLLAAPGTARPPYYNSWLDRYPTSLTGYNVEAGAGTSCQVCHSYASGGAVWNGYGWNLKQHMENGLSITQALAAAEPVDSDLSGYTNLEEIELDTQPGWRVGPNNTEYWDDGTTVTGLLPPIYLLGEMDPGQLAFPFCTGDGTGTPCPCQNESDVAGAGCKNSGGLGGILDASGSSSVAAGDLVLEGSQLLASTPGLFFQGATQVNGGAGIHFGDGLRCVGVSVVRVQILPSDAQGNSATTVDVAAEVGAQPGGTSYYQLWYRDPAASPCGTGFNLTNGLEITWQP